MSFQTVPGQLPDGWSASALHITSEVCIMTETIWVTVQGRSSIFSRSILELPGLLWETLLLTLSAECGFGTHFLLALFLQRN